MIFKICKTAVKKTAAGAWKAVCFSSSSSSMCAKQHKHLEVTFEDVKLHDCAKQTHLFAFG